VSSPVTPTGRYSGVQLPGFWYVACLSRELRRRPIGRTVLGVPLALFRDADGRPAAVLDRCPHRNLPLSLGARRDGLLECRYHGWRFDADGACRLVPGLIGDQQAAAATGDATAAQTGDRQAAAGTGDQQAAAGTGGSGRPASAYDRVARRVASFPVAERDGLVWVVPSREPPGQPEPLPMPQVGAPGYATVWRRRTLSASVHAAVENALDVPHTAFLHRGLFRGRRTPVPVEVAVRHAPGSVEAAYRGEPVPPGIAARLLAPEGGVVEHADRFILPSIAQVEYRLGDSHLLITSAYTPSGEFDTMLHAVVTFRLRAPTALVRAVVVPVADRILRQDAWVLRHQTDNIRRFGGEHFANTPIDVLGPHVARLMRQAARGEIDTEPPPGPEERVTMLT
jgi:phenylpropionate dioxygenase-like ring-hydroxylating dioxygenase large terminal subunit